MRGLLLAVLLLVLVDAAPAAALPARAGWELSAATYPTAVAPGGRGTLSISVYNIGAAPSSGQVTVTDVLPKGIVATDAGNLFTGSEVFPEGVQIEHTLWQCTGIGSEVVTCTNNPSTMSSITGGGASPGDSGREVFDPKIGIELEAKPAAGSGANSITIAGGGALAPASTTDQIPVGASPSTGGFTGWDGWFSNADGSIDTQAGSHPYLATFVFYTAMRKPPASEAGGEIEPVGGDIRNIEVQLPPGFIGDPDATPRCTQEQFEDEAKCPVASEVGLDQTTFSGGGIAPKVYNLVPPAGVAAEFGFNESGFVVRFDAAVRTGGDYGLSEHIDDAPQVGVLSNVLTLWGVPADPSHDAIRRGEQGGPPESSGGALLPLLTLPVACGGPQPFTIRANTYQEPETWFAPATFQTHDQNGTPVGFTGCGALGFQPSIATATDTAASDSPAGLTVEVTPPVAGLLSPEGVSTSDIQHTSVVLPAGLAINPGQAVGLQACQPFQDGVGSEAEPSCPEASKVGEVHIKTPLLEADTEPELTGNVYVLQSNPPNLRLLINANGDGVDLKLVALVHLDEQTGQLTTTLGENAQVEAEDPELQGHLLTPQLPFTDFKLSFSGGTKAALATPAACGVYTTSGTFASWSAQYLPEAFSQSSLAIATGPGGSACPSTPLPFNPTLTAGSTTDQAGGYTDFSLLLQRADAQQRISTLQFKTPEGLLGMISKVPLCDEADANAGTCPAASQIGHTVAESGPGPYPLVIPEPGQPEAPIYLTQGYKGAPYGLSVVVPLHVGPFTLPTQVVRAKIEVDPHTAQLTITTDPLPSIVSGVPTDLREVDAVIDRPGFMFNPTNCNTQSFSGTAASTEGAQAPISTPFGVGSCQSLKFAPNFKVTTTGRTSKANGASLTAKIVYPTSIPGDNQASSQSNIAAVKVDLPKQLPSRLTTLQKACTAKVFEENPANCPKDSVVGHATAVTPVLPVALNGPAYFVSHGGEAFPSLIIVLQGYGITYDLVGTTFISKAGITSSTFKQVADVPISSFELTLPEGKFSALAANLPAKANHSFCGQTLAMPTAFVGQNGAEIHDSTPISVEGCSSSLSFTHSVKQKTVTLSVYAPTTGRLTAGGKGLTTQAKTAKGPEDLTFTLEQKHAGKQKTTVKVTFTPTTGKDRKKQSKSAKLTFEK